MDPSDALPRRGPWWALVVAVVALLAVGGLAVDDGHPAAAPGQTPTDDDAASAMLTVSPGGALAFDEIPTEHRPHYLAAEADAEAFTAVRCYCGCEEMLDHADLRRCFLRLDGAWERHALGCAVCRAEAEMVVELRDEGRSLEEIVDAIDDRYASITADA